MDIKFVTPDEAFLYKGWSNHFLVGHHLYFLSLAKIPSTKTLINQVYLHWWLFDEAMVILTARRNTNRRKQEQIRKHEMKENERGLPIYSRAYNDFGRV